MDQLQGYESDGSTRDDIGSQEYNEEFQLDDSIFRVVSDAEGVVVLSDGEQARRSPSRSPGRL